MSSPKISVVIPSFNKVKFIGQTLDSIFNQKYPNLEVIIQDGGSTDGTVDVIKKYVLKYPKQISFESKKDKGQLDAVNKGLRKTSGEIVTLINADDVYTDKAFSEIGKAYLKNPKALWFTGRGIVIDRNGSEIAKAATFYKKWLLSLNSRNYLLMTNYLMQPSTFLTRKAYEKYGPFTGTEKFLMEYDLWLKISKDEMPVIIPEVLSEFRIESATKSKSMTKEILSTDELTVKRYTDNKAILFLHRLHNLARTFIGNFI